jgi:UDP-N-acetylmuramate dehydrogenase
MAAAYTLAWDVPLRDRNTFHLDVRAACLATVHDVGLLPEVLGHPAVGGLPVMTLGEGSNLLFAAPRHEGLLLHLTGRAARIVADEGSHARVHVEAALPWDSLVDWTLQQGLQGLENLALIPGQSGAAPIQNIGAYGVEVREFLVAVHAFDRAAGRDETLGVDDCGFGYRDSVFKRDPDRRIVTALELRLPRSGPTRTAYAGLAEELAAMGDAPATPRNVAEAVRRLRRRKLPDPAVLGNAGSFFKNPLVARDVAERLQASHPDAPVHPGPHADQRKLSAAWLIERAGWRGFRDGDAGIAAQHALVLVNHGRASGAELLGLARRVAESVLREFGVQLEPEPRIVDAAFGG